MASVSANSVLKRLRALQEALHSLELNPNTPADRRRARCVENCSRVMQLIIANRLKVNATGLRETVTALEELSTKMTEESKSIRKSVENMQVAAQVFTGLAGLIRIV